MASKSTQYIGTTEKNNGIVTFMIRAYPRLKDAQIESSKYPALYYQLVKNVRTMYQVCKLVHADLSEYNILYVSNL